MLPPGWHSRFGFCQENGGAGSCTGSWAGHSSSALLSFVALMQDVLQGSQLTLLYSIHHSNVILLFRIKLHFGVCMCIYGMYEYVGMFVCVYTGYVCVCTGASVFIHMCV